MKIRNIGKYIKFSLLFIVGAMTLILGGCSSRNVIKEYKISDNISSISVKANTANITFAPSSEDCISIVSEEKEHIYHSVKVEGDTLEIERVDERKWYQRIVSFSNSLNLTVYLPSNEYSALLINGSTGNVNINCDARFSGLDVKVSTGNISIIGTSYASLKAEATTGNISISNVSCTNDISIDVSTGNVNLGNISCQNLSVNGTTGDLSLTNAVIVGKLDLRASTGNVTLDGCDGGEIYIETSTGRVSGTLLSPKIFIGNSTTGKRSLPKTTTGGICEINTTTGNVNISIK